MGIALQQQRTAQQLTALVRLVYEWLIDWLCKQSVCVIHYMSSSTSVWSSIRSYSTGYCVCLIQTLPTTLTTLTTHLEYTAYSSFRISYMYCCIFLIHMLHISSHMFCLNVCIATVTACVMVLWCDLCLVVIVVVVQYWSRQASLGFRNWNLQKRLECSNSSCRVPSELYSATRL
jgi:hypothetical protein